jgi:hypothetical protein
MDAPPDAFYTDERWGNWLSRIREADIDPAEEDSARLLLNLQEDAAIAVAKVLGAYVEGALSEEEALSELAGVREIVLAEPEIEGEETAALVGDVQLSLEAAFYAAEAYVADGAAEVDLERRLHAAADAEADDDLDTAFKRCAEAGTRIIDGASLDPAAVKEIDYGYVFEWADGLASLESAMRDPEVIEADEEG